MATRKAVKKSVEEITKSNLNRVLDKLKNEVAAKEEIWLETMMELLPMTIPEGDQVNSFHIARASELADVVLQELERRWGK